MSIAARLLPVVLVMVAACGFSPGPGAWRQAAEPPLGTAGASITVLADGRVLLAGGYLRDDRPSPAAEVYDPRSDAWTHLPDMPGPRGGQGSVLLKDGRVLLVGGTDGAQALASTLYFEPVTQGWKAGPPLLANRIGPDVELLPDGRAIAMAGYRQTDPTQQYEAVATTELLDLAKEKWSAGPALPQAAGSPIVVRLADGSLLAAGGGNYDEPVTTSEVFDPHRNTWTRVGDMPVPVSFGAAARLADGKVLLAGVRAASSPETVVMVYDPRHRVWTPGQNPPAGGYPLLILPARQGRLLLVEASANQSKQMVGGAVYDPATSSWSPIAAFVERMDRGVVYAAPLPGGSALIVAQTVHVFDPDVRPPSASRGTDLLSSPVLTLGEAGLVLLLLAALGVRALLSGRG